MEWLKALSENDKKVIIEYEIYNYKCIYTENIKSILKLFKGIFDYRLIISVWCEVKDKHRASNYSDIEK
jgi:hypothetical protein